jgi:hypothetical protein
MAQLADWFQPQRLRQEGSMDCGVPVFGALLGLTRDQILRDIPNSTNGLTVDQWKDYSKTKIVAVVQYGPDEDYPLPAAHLVCGLHWVYQAKDGGFHDPSPVFESTPPKLITIAQHYGGRILTIAVVPAKGW